MGKETGVSLKNFKGFRLTNMPTEEPLSPGHRACQGCGEIAALRMVMKALGNNVVVVSATGCMEIVTSPYPQTAWNVPWLHVAFENASAVVSGVESAYKAMIRKKKIEDEGTVFLAYGGDGATADIGLQSLSGALERGHNFLYVCLDNEAYMNTGVQRSSSTPYGAMTTTSPPGKMSMGQSTWKKNMPAIVAAHGIPYVATASPAFPVDLMNKVRKAAMMPGPAYIHIYSPCPTGWRASPESSIELARLAVLSRVFPLYEVVNGKWIMSQPEKAACGAACPAGIDIQGFVGLIAQGRFLEALKVIKQDNPLPAICGRVCHHPCELVCGRSEADGAVAIEYLKRFVADLDLKSEMSFVPEKRGVKKDKVAIVGAGPAGLTAAYYLAIEGYPVTIFDNMPEPGGWLVYGIPEFRLPRDIMKAEIDVIRKLGVEFRLGVEVGKDVSLEDLRNQGFHAFFIAVGTQKSLQLGVPGEGLEGVFAGGDFLKKANLGQVEAGLWGKSVAVIGGGNVAMDSARMALRLGAKEVRVLYRRSRQEMPAGEEEIVEAEEESIQFNFLTAPVEILGDAGGKVKEVRCIQMQLCEPDASGRCRPEPVSGSEHVVAVDVVIAAIGLGTDLSMFGDGSSAWQPTLTDWGTIEVDRITYATSIPGVFAGGDVVTGAATVVGAIEAGKEVAISIDRYLGRKDLAKGRAFTNARMDLPVEASAMKGRRAAMPRLAGDVRKTTHDEVHIGYAENQAIQEARCCLHCGVSGGPERVTVVDYFKKQRRFRHLTDIEVEKIQKRVDEEYEALRERCGLR
jgi:NADPH-dependent glutamate synthase beta subunit-like oxidoreductase